MRCAVKLVVGSTVCPLELTRLRVVSLNEATPQFAVAMAPPVSVKALLSFSRESSVFVIGLLTGSRANLSLYYSFNSDYVTFSYGFTS